MGQGLGSYLGRIGIRQQVYAVSVVAIVGLFAALSVVLVQVARQHDLHELSDAAIAGEQIIASLHMQILEARRAERDFLLQRDERFSGDHAEVGRQVNELLGSLRIQLEPTGMQALAPKVDALEAAFDRYRDTFRRTAEDLRALGFDETGGLEGSLRASMQQAEEALTAAGERDLLVLLLKMRQRERDVMLRFDPRAWGEVRAQAQELQRTLAASASPIRGAVGEWIGAYRRHLEIYGETRLRLTRQTEELSGSFAEIEPVAKEIHHAFDHRFRMVRDADEESRAELERLMWLSGAGILVACVFVAGFTGNAIVKPITRITRAVEQVAGGDLDTDVHGTERADEVGTLARSLEVFKSALIEKKRADDAAATAREVRYKLLAENTSDIIILGHDNGRRSYISPAVRNVLGFEPEEAVALPLRQLVHPDDISQVFAATGSLSPAHPQATALHRMRRKDGGYIWAETVIRRFETEGAGGPTIVAAVRDVTERQRQAEALLLAKETAESGSRAKTEFLASMSHEIRTPLNGILGFTNLLLERTDLPPDVTRKLDLIRISGAALLTVVNDVLDFSKIEAGAVDLDVQPFSPGALVDSCTAILHKQAAAKDLLLSAEVEPSVPPAVLGDEARLRQILLNLLNNAIKFTPSGSVRVRVSTEGGERLRFSVRDTGIGIPADKQGRLFRRFSQIDGSHGRQFGGTGLGLAISKSLVELMGGEIGVVSQAGDGSTFWFSVPLRASAAPHLRAGGGGHAGTGADSVARILLAEDVEINQEIARAVLEAAGHQVDVVCDGLQAVGAVRTGAYDLVLMDVQMPGMDGVTATRQIRALEEPHRSIPIVALTANVYAEQVAAFQQAGFDDHVGKPFQRGELQAVVERWCRVPEGKAAETSSAA